MKKLFLSILVLATGYLLLGTSVSVQAQVDPMNLPALTEYVTDFSNVLNADQLIELRGMAKAYEDKTSTQIVAVLFPNRNGNELFDIGIKIGNENQIGQKKLNNGLLLVISTDEKKIRIMVGYGLEGSIPDALASDIIETDLRPYVNGDDFYNAVKGFYTRSISAIDNDESVNFKGNSINSSSSSFDNNYSGILFLFIFLGYLLSRNKFFSKLFKKNPKLKKYNKFWSVGLFVLLFVLFNGFLFILSSIIAIIIGGLILGFMFGLLGIWGGGKGGGFFFGGGGGSGGGGFSGGGFSGGGGGFGGGGAGD